MEAMEMFSIILIDSMQETTDPARDAFSKPEEQLWLTESLDMKRMKINCFI
jgi:hypothetical protein